MRIWATMFQLCRDKPPIISDNIPTIQRQLSKTQGQSSNFLGQISNFPYLSHTILRSVILQSTQYQCVMILQGGTTL